MSRSENREVKFVYFDVGGVVVLDFSKTNKWNEMLDDLEIGEEKREAFAELFDKHEQKICIGEAIEVFVDEARNDLGISFPKNYSMTADFVNRFEKNTSIQEVLDILRGKVKLGLLTNMYPNMFSLIEKRGLFPEINWDVIIDSSVERVAKPQEEIFRLAEKRGNEKPDNMLFVENTQRHLDAASRLGWQTFCYDPSNLSESNRDLLKNLIG